MNNFNTRELVVKALIALAGPEDSGLIDAGQEDMIRCVYCKVGVDALCGATWNGYAARVFQSTGKLIQFPHGVNCPVYKARRILAMVVNELDAADAGG